MKPNALKFTGTVVLSVLMTSGCSRDPKPKSGILDGCTTVACTPGDARECDIDGSPGVEICSPTCQWNACQLGTVDSAGNPLDSDSDTDTAEVFIPPAEHCPEGTIEFNFPNIWSADAPLHLVESAKGLPFDSPPNTVLIKGALDGSMTVGASLHTDNCQYYRTCLPPDLNEFYFVPVDPAQECVEGSTVNSCNLFVASFSMGDIETASMNDDMPGVVTMAYDGESADLTNDYFNGAYTGTNGSFHFLPGRPEVTGSTDPLEWKPACTQQDDFITLHVRWPWSDPEVTGLAGTACEDDLFGISTPPYPSTLMIKRGEQCSESVAVLERQDNTCPWYRILIPKSQWQGGSVSLSYLGGETEAWGTDIPLPETDADEVWLVYEGAPDDADSGSVAPCNNYSNRPNLYKFYTSNLGPGYAGCGGQPVPDTECAEIYPIGHSVIHLRYIWAGQKTFTYFPRDDFMPSWVMLEVDGPLGKEDVICVQEGKSPWFRCPVPNGNFGPDATWRAVDRATPNKTGGGAEWNTVCPRPFPDTPGTYWLRWTYGKPDICETSEFEFTTFYPDGAEYAKAGEYGDDFCFNADTLDRPPIMSDGYYPWNETNYDYGFGSSIAKYYDDSVGIQKLLNYFIWERWQRWKDKYLAYDDCSEGTARAKTDPPETVSEGQGYAMAIAGAIGDKETFTKLWKFVRHYLSQKNEKYCGGLMGWMWDGEDACRPLDKPCDVDAGDKCGGNNDSAFDGDVDIAIGLVYAAWQWPEFTQDAVEWLLKMECAVNNRYDGVWYYPTPGDTWNKDCSNYPREKCKYVQGVDDGKAINMSYYPPGYFRVFGEFLANKLNPAQYTTAERRNHLDFWYRTAETVWELTERCYDTGTHPALYTDWGSYATGCGTDQDNYNWSRGLWRVAIDVAWYGHDQSFYSSQPESSRKYPEKSQMQAKMDAIQDYYAFEFPENNPAVENANRFSTICKDLNPSGVVSGCDPAYDHNSYFVNTAMCAFATDHDNDGKTTHAIRREALEESVTVAIQNDRYYQESIGIYTLLFLSGNFPKPFSKMEPQITIE